jgi:hypothetical protein
MDDLVFELKGSRFQLSGGGLWCSNSIRVCLVSGTDAAAYHECCRSSPRHATG